MATDSKATFKLFGDALDRQDSRNWTSRLENREISREDAVNFVAQVFKDQKGNTLPYKGVGVDYATGFFAFGDYFADILPTEEELNRVINLSDTDYYADLSLQLLRMISRQDPSPALKAWEDRRYLGQTSQRPKPPGQSPYRYLNRDLVIVSQLRQIALCGFAPTRSDATRSKNSACDIIADALKRNGIAMDYRNIEAIWKKRERMKKAGAFASAFHNWLLNYQAEVQTSSE